MLPDGISVADIMDELGEGEGGISFQQFCSFIRSTTSGAPPGLGDATCTACGSQLMDDAIFCRKCGVRARSKREETSVGISVREAAGIHSASCSPDATPTSFGGLQSSCSSF